MPHQCEGLRGLWEACPSPLVVNAKEGVYTVVNAGVVLFLVVLFLLAALIGHWVSSMTGLGDAYA